MSHGEDVFWLMIVPAYALGWLLCSALFTRLWVTKDHCAKGCTRWEREYETPRGSHVEGCNKWGNHPLDPSDAMGFAIAWPLTLINLSLTYVHRYEPKLKPGKTVRLTERTLEALDRVLEDTTIKEMPRHDDTAA